MLSFFLAATLRSQLLFELEKFFLLWVPWYNVRLQRFGKPSSIPLIIHLSKPFSVMTFSTCSSSLHWLKSEVIFFWFPEQSLVHEETFDFFCLIFCRLFMKAKSSSRKSAFFLMIANCVQANIGISVHVWSWIYFSLNFSTFAVECDWNRILETIKIWGFWKIKWVFSNKISEIFKIATCGTFLKFVSNSNFS